jgi:hypothetical protein
MLMSRGIRDMIDNVDAERLPAKVSRHDPLGCRQAKLTFSDVCR